MSNNFGLSDFWKDRDSLVLCLDILERQDIIDTDIGRSLQNYNQQLINQFLSQNYGSRSDDLPFYTNLLLYRLSYKRHLLDEDKMMFIRMHTVIPIKSDLAIIFPPMWH